MADVPSTFRPWPSDLVPLSDEVAVHTLRSHSCRRDGLLWVAREDCPCGKFVAFSCDLCGTAVLAGADPADGVCEHAAAALVRPGRRGRRGRGESW